MKGYTLREAELLDSGLDMLEQTVQVGDISQEDFDRMRALRRELGDFINEVSNSSTTLMLWTDGAARPTNPGPAGIGVVGKMNGRVVIEVSEYIGRTSNNVAEYMAAVTALRRAVDLGVKKVKLHCDSQLVVNQYTGKYECNTDTLQPLLGRLRGLAERFDYFEVQWISRKENREADGLSVAGAYEVRACGACTHPFHLSLCTEPGTTAGEACGCPYGFQGGLKG